MLEILEGAYLRAHKVRYVKDYHINIDKLERGKKSVPFYLIRDAIFLRKTHHWKHEREYRIVRPLSDCDDFRPPKQRTPYRDIKIYLFPITPKCISSVIFGVNTSRDIKHKIISSSKDSNISFLQTIILKDHQNEIKFLPIDSFGSVEQFLSMLPQLFTADSIEAKYKENIPVKTLSEIPYYHLQQEDYDTYYRKQKEKRKIKRNRERQGVAS